MERRTFLSTGAAAILGVLAPGTDGSQFMTHELYDGDPSDPGSTKVGELTLNGTDDAVVLEHTGSGENLVISSSGISGVAPDPHGSSVHDGDVAHDGDDVAFGALQVGGDPWADIREYGAEDGVESSSAIQQAIDENGYVFIPDGTFPIDTTIDIDAPRRISGPRHTTSEITWTGSGDASADDLIRFSDNSQRKSGVYLANLRLTDAPRDGVHMRRCHEWKAENLRIQDFGRYGMYFNQTWKGMLANVATSGTGDAGFYADTGAHAMSYNSCYALSVDTGFVPGAQSSFNQITAENNDIGFDISGVEVAISGYYAEAAGGTIDANDPPINIRVRDGATATIDGGKPMVRTGIGIDVDSESHAIIDGGGALEDYVGQSGQFAWDTANDDVGNLGVRVAAGGRLTYDGPDVPISIGDVTQFTKPASAAFRTADAIDGVGLFHGTGTADGWTNRSGNEPDSTSVSDDSAFPFCSGRQYVDPGEDGDGVELAIDPGLNANTDYTIGLLLENASTVVQPYDDAGDQLGSVAWQPNELGARIVTSEFTSSGSPTTDTIGFEAIDGSNADSEFWLDGVTVVEGSYGPADLPLPDPTRRYGTEEQTGNGSETEFSWPHRMTEEPVEWDVTPTTAAAGARHHVEIGDAEFSVTFDSPPGNGDGLGWRWRVSR